MTTFAVNSVASLMTALASAQGGDQISLASGTYSGLSLQNFNFTSAVTITSADPTKPAVFTNFTLANSSGMVFSQLDFNAAGSTDPY